MKLVFALFAILALVASVQSRASLLLAEPERVIADSYIVVLHANVSSDLKQGHITRFAARSADFQVQAAWSVINGYSAKIVSKDALNEILADPMVDFVEQDQVFTIADSVATQNLGNNAAGLWGLNRIWQRTRASTTTYNYWATAGSGVDVYVVDTGLNPSHSEFVGRTVTGASFVTDTGYPGTADGNGHGTHVSSTAAGTTYGVAKLASIIPVKVLSASGSGSTTGVISGVDFVRTNSANRGRPSVANLSLGGGASTALDNAVNNAVTAGAFFAVAAGNENQNAGNTSPARAANAFAVGASTNTDARSSFSNFGTAVQLFAPGSNILGAWIGSGTATNTISGTSMASPHVAGAAALYFGHLLESGTRATPAQAKAALNAIATPNVITSPGTGSPNRLLYTATSD